MELAVGVQPLFMDSDGFRYCLFRHPLGESSVLLGGLDGQAVSHPSDEVDAEERRFAVSCVRSE